MGKYEEKLKPVAMGIIGKQAEAEIAALEDQIKDLRAACEQKQEIIDSYKDSIVPELKASYKALLARVEAHNEVIRKEQQEIGTNDFDCFIINTGEGEG